MDRVDDFEAFVVDVEPRLRRALVAAYGPERGREATAEALAWAWEHWQRCRSMEHPVAFLFRVGQSRSRRRKEGVLPWVDSVSAPWIEPKLATALTQLTPNQRVSVVLVHGFQWHLREVAELLGIKTTTVQSHVERGLAHLHHALEGASHDRPAH